MDSDGSDLRKSLDERFRDLKVGKTTPEDYHLLDEIISTLREGAWTRDNFESDYEKLKTDIYDALLGGKIPKTEEREDYAGEIEADDRNRAVIDFTFDWLRYILNK